MKLLPGEKEWAQVEKRPCPYGLPGEEGEAVGKGKEVRLVSLEKVHPLRVAPLCPHFGLCGGCNGQHVALSWQREWKEEQVKKFLAREGLDPQVVRPLRAGSPPWEYRSKMEFTFSPEGRLGLHERGRFDSLLPLSDCSIAHPFLAQAMKVTGAWARDWSLSGYDKRTHRGLLRHLRVRWSASEEKVLAAISATEQAGFPAGSLADWVHRLRGALPLAGALLLVQKGMADALQEESSELLWGRDYLVEEVEGIRFRLQHGTFFQVNREAVALLWQRVKGFLSPSPGMKVLDLYAGTGAFTLLLAKEGAEAVGVEIYPPSVEKARENATENGLSARFVAGDVRRTLTHAKEIREVSWDAVLLDPPRSGAGRRVMAKVASLEPATVVYVSCQPETFAQDGALLARQGYQLLEVEPLDLFPHTPHVELVSWWQRQEKVRPLKESYGDFSLPLQPGWGKDPRGRLSLHPG
ncbi:MAG: 23S rRNA (uracil(1939)-C(5))-methyltransferase RlmD [Bacillota bacterium]|nr:23S rRNA (uracil(1939)-C(5))-methyltransferase RlmD [Bacillota bacterium]